MDDEKLELARQALLDFSVGLDVLLVTVKFLLTPEQLESLRDRFEEFVDTPGSSGSLLFREYTPEERVAVYRWLTRLLR